MNDAITDLPTEADEMFCFAVYSASHAINRAYQPLLRSLGLTYPQYITLTVLWQTDGLSVGALSQRLGMDSNTLTPLLKNLERSGHISRQHGTKDERQVFVNLTKTGRNLQSSAPNIVACMIDNTGMEKSQLKGLVATLTEMVGNLNQVRQSQTR